MIKSRSSNAVRRCSKCGRPLAQANNGTLCFSCQPRTLKKPHEYGVIKAGGANRNEYMRAYRSAKKAAAI